MKISKIGCYAFALVAVIGCKGGGGGGGGWKAAVGDGGTIVETFDDASWDVHKVSDHNLRAVSCINNEIGWAAGSKGFIGHTIDGGWSWPAQASGVDAELYAISFAYDADKHEVGIAAGENGTLLTTRDGGASWLKVALPELTSVTWRGTAITQGATLLLAVGTDGSVARSSDQGQSFEHSAIDGATTLTDVALDAAGNLALAVDSAGSIWRSRDAGKSFTLEHSASRALESVSLGRSGALGSATGAGGSMLLRSKNGAWTELAPVSASDLHATLVGPDEDRVYFAGDGGTLVETTALGSTTGVEQTGTLAALRGLEDLEAR